MWLASYGRLVQDFLKLDDSLQKKAITMNALKIIFANVGGSVLGASLTVLALAAILQPLGLAIVHGIFGLVLVLACCGLVNGVALCVLDFLTRSRLSPRYINAVSVAVLLATFLPILTDSSQRWQTFLGTAIIGLGTGLSVNSSRKALGLRPHARV